MVVRSLSSKDAVERAKYEPLRSEPAEPVSDALETLPYGLYIIGSRDESDKTNGMMADWLMQVSFKPRLVACSFENDATTLNNVRATHVFSVNVLPAEAYELAARFAQPRDASKIKLMRLEASEFIRRFLTFHTRAWIAVTPPSCRMPPGR